MKGVISVIIVFSVVSYLQHLTLSKLCDDLPLHSMDPEPVIAWNTLIPSLL